MGRKRGEKKTQSEQQQGAQIKTEIEGGWEVLKKLRHA